MAERIKAFAAFWYDFIIGDDWLVAAGVVIALAITYAVSRTSVRTRPMTMRAATCQSSPMMKSYQNSPKALSCFI